MKLWKLLIAGGVLAACDQSAVAPNSDSNSATTPDPTESAIVIPDIEPEPRAYDDAWDLVEFWSGEWPNGVSVVDAGVSVMGHAEMDPNSPQDVNCPLPQFATYHPWNAERNDADLIEYWSANEIQEIDVLSDFTVETAFAGETKTISAKAGDVIRYRYYLAEGYFIGEHEGESYELSEGEIADFISFPTEPAEAHEWLNVRCGDEAGTRAWLRFDEIRTTPGIQPASLSEYGVAKDLQP